MRARTIPRVYLMRGPHNNMKGVVLSLAHLMQTKSGIPTLTGFTTREYKHQGRLKIEQTKAQNASLRMSQEISKRTFRTV